MVPAAGIVWGSAAWLVVHGTWLAMAVAVLGAAAAAVLGRRQAARPWAVGAICLVAVAASCAWRLTAIEHSPLTELAQQGEIVTLDLEIVRDARAVAWRGDESVVVEVRVRRVVADALDVTLHDRATAFVPGAADELVVGRRLVVRGRLSPSDRTQEAALIHVLRRGEVDRAAWWWEGSERVREGVRRSVSHLDDEPRALVPALVDGDDTRVSETVAEDFRRSGLTHLMAVSGTNLTIVLGLVMVLARAAGLGRRWLWLAGALSIVAFILLARPDPSVLRAAAMGAVGVAALGFGARGGVRALCWALIGLLFLDPWLARTPGFILSAVATGGILLLTPVIAGRLQTWMPRWCALAVAVPLAAQLACTPVIAALSGEVSLVAVFANLLVAPAVAPATVAGLLGGLAALIWLPLGQLAGTVAGACVSWILTIGHRAASLDAASLQWSAPWQVLLIAVPVATWLVVRLAVHPAVFVGCTLALLVGMWRPPQPGWPPDGWVMVACDVGQGDANVLNAGDGEAVVVDAGPDAASVDRCLRRLGVQRIRLMVFTHAHADHVDGWSGVRRGRSVDQIAVGASGGPRWNGAPRHVVAPDEVFAAGEVSARVLWPPAADDRATPESAANDASIVLMVRVRGVRLLLTGDIEPAAQDDLLRTGADLAADVLKLPHHGSGRQSERFFSAVGAPIATISAGRDNDYGHPAAAALGLLQEQGTRWWRTDLDGDIAIVRRDGRVVVVTR